MEPKSKLRKYQEDAENVVNDTSMDPEFTKSERFKQLQKFLGVDNPARS